MAKKDGGRVKYKNADFRLPKRKKTSETKTNQTAKKTAPSRNSADTKSKSAEKNEDKNTETKEEKGGFFDDIFSQEQKDPEKLDSNLRFYSVLLFSVAILLGVMIIFKGTSGWAKLHDFITGLFGIPVFLIPIGFGLTVYKIETYLKYRKIEIPIIKIELLKTIGLTIAVCAFCQVMFGSVKNNGFFKEFGRLFILGSKFKSAGGMSSVIAYPLVNYTDPFAAKVIVVLIAFIVIMWVLGSSVSQFMKFVAHPFKTMENSIEKRRQLEEPDPDTDKDEWISVSNTQKIPPIKDEHLKKGNLDIDVQTITLSGKNIAKGETFSHNGSDFMLDVPIPGEDPYIPAEDDIFNMENEKKRTAKKTPEKVDNPAVNKPSEDKNSTAADSLEKMIIKATSEPETKKDKRQERTDMMLSVNEEFRKRQGQTADGYEIPPVDFLEYAKHKQKDQSELREKGRLLQETFNSFGVKAYIDDITMGPTVIRYEVKPAPGVKVSKVTNLADDIALNLAAENVRIEAPIPGKSAIGIEVPNNNRDIVSLRELLESDKFLGAKSKLAFAVGKDISGNAVIGDIAKMPHVIIAGSTGSGKSVCTNSIIMSILYHASPSEVKLILIDPKIVEFRVYDGIPHLLIPVVTDPKKAAGALNWAVQEMLRRYQVFAQTGVRDLNDYNEWCREEGNESEPMPQIVITIDELADLMMAASKEVEDAICRLAQMARAAGMHLIIATQRPTTDIITGLIKANIPSRIALSVMSSIDSRTILDTTGAEKLLGHGDMLYFPSNIPKPVRVQGCYVSTKEIEKVVEFIKAETPTDYSQEIMKAVEENVPVTKGDKGISASGDADISGDDTELINRALEIIASSGQASTSLMQRRLKLGYARAARIMDQLEEMGVIGPSEGAKPRRVKITYDQVEDYKIK